MTENLCWSSFEIYFFLRKPWGIENQFNTLLKWHERYESAIKCITENLCKIHLKKLYILGDQIKDGKNKI